jgi:hypothetical protein
MLTTVLEVAGFLLIAAAVVALLGLAGALASAGAACLLVSWLLERR